MEHFKNKISIEPICFSCKHFIDNGAFTCKAFPHGIPDIIFTENEHDKPLKEQSNDIVFTPNDGKK